MMVQDLVEELLRENGPSAIVLREELEPVEGKDGVFFPPTFAPPTEQEQQQEKKRSQPVGEAGLLESWVIVDTVESQANRIEQVFKTEEYRSLVPQIKFEVGDKRKIELNLLDLGHRVADAIARYSTLRPEIDKALEDFRKGNAGSLAALSPTSLLFGFWDSRETGVKWPRLLRSEIIAYKVAKLKRSAQYVAPLLKEQKPEKEWKVYTEISSELEELYKTELKGNDKKFKDFLGRVGLGSIPAGELVGGYVLLEGGSIKRDAVLHLTGLRTLTVLDSGKIDEKKTKLLKEYILMLGLLALTLPQDYNLRQGCLLARKGNPRIEKVYRDGRREKIELSHQEILESARKISKQFRTEFKAEDRTEKVRFDKRKLKEDRERFEE